MTSHRFQINWDAIVKPDFLRGNAHVAHRDPAGHYHDGLFRVFHTRVHHESDGFYYAFVAVTESRDLINWTEPRTLTPKERRLNYSSPGNVRDSLRWPMDALFTDIPDAECHALRR